MTSSNLPPDDLFESQNPRVKPPALPPADEDGDEYELEAPDEAVLEGERRRGEEEVLAAQSTVDIDAIYREAEEQTDLSELLKGVRFRYQTKHLLILTAVVAVLLTAVQLTGVFTTLVLVILFTLVGIHVFLGWRESQRQQEVERRRRQIYERQRLVRAGQPVSPLPPLEAAEKPPEPPSEPEPFQFSQSQNEILATLAVAAVLLGVLYLFPSGTAAVVVGIVALIGLVVHAVGYKPPGTVVLCWWMLLVMYVVVSVLAAFRGAAG